MEDCFQKDSISHLLSHIPQILTQKEYEVIRCRYGLNGQDPLTQREIARNLSISRSYVSRIEKMRSVNSNTFPKNSKGRTFFFVLPLKYLFYSPLRRISNTSGVSFSFT